MSPRNSRKIAAIEVKEILTGGSMAAKPSPVEHVATPSSPAPSAGSSGRASFQSHTRAMSAAADWTTSTAPRTNRFSMSFPVQPSSSTSPTRISQSPVRDAPPVVPESVPSPKGPTDTNYLTAIATQERRVLELKEELARAQADLNRLKKHWAQHEAQKKRQDAKSVTKLQPLQTALPATDREEDPDGSSAWMQQEMERRKAMLSGNRSSNRTVFSGSRHTRTLSLLSPVNRAPTTGPNAQRSALRPPRKESLSESARQAKEEEVSQPRPKMITRASTTPDLTVDGTQSAEPLTDLTEKALYDDPLLQTGKKMATDLKDGLWTFWEDLRQATVGDEAAQIQPPQRQNSARAVPTAKKKTTSDSLRPSSRGATAGKSSAQTRKPSPARKHTKTATMSLGSTPALADPSFWSEHGVLSQQATPAPTKKAGSGWSPKHAKSSSTVRSIASSETDAWDTWDDGSPEASRSSSAASESTTQPSTVGTTSPRTSSDVTVKMNDRQSDRIPQVAVKKEPIPWPALSNLGPKALRRTASHLMSEWEKSMTPSPSKELSGQTDYLGLGAEAAAASRPERT